MKEWNCENQVPPGLGLRGSGEGVGEGVAWDGLVGDSGYEGVVGWWYLRREWGR